MKTDRTEASTTPVFFQIMVWGGFSMLNTTLALIAETPGFFWKTEYGTLEVTANTDGGVMFRAGLLNVIAATVNFTGKYWRRKELCLCVFPGPSEKSVLPYFLAERTERLLTSGNHPSLT